MPVNWFRIQTPSNLTRRGCRAKIHVPLAAAVVVFLAVTKSIGGKDDLKYLGIACGFFGRMAMWKHKSIKLFDEINQLSAVAHRTVNQEENIPPPPPPIAGPASKQLLNTGVDEPSLSSVGAKRPLLKFA